MGADIVDKRDPSAEGKVQDELYICPNCGEPVIRVGCHAVCMHCGYQEGCGD
ncbi:MAG TPA: 50S ribosomal protein L32 [Thermodesulfobacteriota bacterium]|nr:50S ribosomal protein L32 [Thermodesulfobacteriota bacterium]